VFVQPSLQWKSSKYYIFWVWVVALGIQNAKCMLSSMIFFHIISQMAWFSKNDIEHVTSVLIFCTIFVRNISCSEKNWARYSQRRLTVFMYNTPYTCQIIIKPEFSRETFEKCSKISNLMKISLVRVELFHADRRTDEQMDRQADRYDKDNSHLLQFCKCHQKLKYSKPPTCGSSTFNPLFLRLFQ
jgi:hypothetical protein